MTKRQLVMYRLQIFQEDDVVKNKEYFFICFVGLNVINCPPGICLWSSWLIEKSLTVASDLGQHKAIKEAVNQFWKKELLYGNPSITYYQTTALDSFEIN